MTSTPSSPPSRDPSGSRPTPSSRSASAPRPGEPAAPRLFGTDGIRGVFGEPPLDRATVVAVGYRLGSMLAAEASAPRVVLGGDTRDSTPTLCSWLAAGLAAAGAGVSFAGVVPTPAIAFLTQAGEAHAGVVVSASHNPHPDNGIKLLDGDGFKWSEEAEAELERGLDEARERLAELPDAELEPDPGAADAYLEHLETSVHGDRPLAGLKLLIDAANGAASPFARPLFADLGAEVTVIHDRPDGSNINRGCGSTSPEELERRIAAGGFDLGIAFDGDADRALLVDETGEPRDGDAMLYLWALELESAGELDPRRIVATTMSNLGLERALAARGIALERCGVGDRQVVETLRREGLVLGGEQSGHVVHLGLASTGDGLLTALQLAAIVARSGRPLSELLDGFQRFPQVLVNVRVGRKPPFDEIPAVAARAREIEEALGDDGRLLLRYSGTEPLARVMIEGADQARIEALANDLAEVIRGEIG